MGCETQGALGLSWLLCSVTGSGVALGRAEALSTGLEVVRRKETDLVREQAPGRSKPQPGDMQPSLSVSVFLSLLNFISLW